MKKALLIPVLCAMCISCSSHSSVADGSQMQSNVHQPADWQITANVKQIIMSDSSLSKGARMISVTTNDGVVILSGIVENRREGEKVIAMVKDTPGVVRIENHLTLAHS